MILAKKVRLHPTPLQEQKLWQSAGVSRWAYNFALDIKQKTYKQTGKAINEGNIRKLITQMKQTEEYSWLKEVSAQVPKQAVKDLDKRPIHTPYITTFQKEKAKNGDE